MANVAFATDVADPRPRAAGLPFYQKGYIIFSQAAATFTFTIPAGTRVKDVACVITEAFNGTSPLITIGDSNSAAGYLTSAQIAPATALSVGTPAVIQAISVSNAYQYGKYYPTADSLLVAWTPATATPTTGKAIIFVELLLVTPSGIPAGLVNGSAL